MRTVEELGVRLEYITLTRIQKFSLQIRLTTSAFISNIDLLILGVLCFDSLQYPIFSVN
jgi:hypothetical protein